jgi:predicted MFS family arabinose efflux permease
MMLVSILITPMFILGLVAFRGWHQLPMLLGLGLTMPATHVVSLALMQEYCPDNRALATGVLLSMTFISESLGAVLLGAFADVMGLEVATALAAIVFLVSLPLVFLLPRQRAAAPPTESPA